MTQNKLEKIADYMVREVEVLLEGDARLNEYKSALLRCTEDGIDLVWLHDSNKTDGVEFHYHSLYKIISDWGYDMSDIEDFIDTI